MNICVKSTIPEHDRASLLFLLHPLYRTHQSDDFKKDTVSRNQGYTLIES